MYLIEKIALLHWCNITKKIETGWHITLSDWSVSISHEMSQDQAKCLPSLAELNSSNGVFLTKPSEIVKQSTQPRIFSLQQKINPF